MENYIFISDVESVIKKGFWIGAQRKYNNLWKWSQSTYAAPLPNWWLPDEPSFTTYGIQDCLLFVPDGTTYGLADEQCSRKNKAICLLD